MRVSSGLFGLAAVLSLVGCAAGPLDGDTQEPIAPAPPAAEVHIVGHRFVPLGTVDPEHLAPGATYGLRVSLAYFSKDGAPQDFDVILRAEDGDLGAWNLRDEDNGKLLGASPDGEGVALRVSGVSGDGSPAVAKVRFETPQMAGAMLRALTLGVSVRSASPNPLLGDDLPRPLQLVVRQD